MGSDLGGTNPKSRVWALSTVGGPGPTAPLSGKSAPLPSLGSANSHALPRVAAGGHQRPPKRLGRAWGSGECLGSAPLSLRPRGLGSALSPVLRARWVGDQLASPGLRAVGLEGPGWSGHSPSKPICSAPGASEARPGDTRGIPQRGQWAGVAGGTACPRAFYLCTGQRVLVHKSLDKLLRPDVS